MRDAERRREIKDYYLGISADEITSYLTPASFDLWESLARYRREFRLGVRWLETGGGMGDLAAAALDRGYDVLMTDVQDELLATAATRHPRLRGRLQRADIFDSRDVQALASHRPFSIVAALGAVLNHARDRKELARGFGHLVALAEPGSLLIVDLMLSEMFPGHPASIWADILHVLPGFADLARLIGASRLHVLETHSLYHRYPPTAVFNADFDERMLRLVLRKPLPPRAREPGRRSEDRGVHDLALGDERQAPRATQPELDEPPDADSAPDCAVSTRRGLQELFDVGAQTAFVDLVVDLAAVALDGAGTKKLRPLAREQRAILVEVDPDEAIRDEDRGALSARHDLAPDRGLHVLLMSLHLRLVVDRHVTPRRRRRGRALGVAVHLGPHLLLLAPLEHLRAKLGRGQDLPRGEGFAVADPAPLLDAVDRQGERPAARRNEHVLEHDAVLLAALQYLAGEQQHVHRAAILDHQRGHGRLVALGDLELAAGARLVERADGERRRAPRAGEPEDREPAVRAVLAGADALEKTPEVAPDGAAR